MAGMAGPARVTPVTVRAVRRGGVPGVVRDGAVRRGLRLTRRGRIALTCVWTMIAGLALWLAGFLAG